MMKKGTKRKIYLIAAVVCIVSVIAEIMFAATKIMAPILQRKEDYYDGGDDKDE